MAYEAYFPVWDQLTDAHRALIEEYMIPQSVKKGTMLHQGSLTCMGLVLIKTGQLRAYMLSGEGREITLYRLFELDVCLFTASCTLRSMQFDLHIEAEKDSEIYVLPPHIFRRLTEESAVMANYVNELMVSRFSEVMWLVEQIMWKSLDKRVASFLIEESVLEGTKALKITHEAIGNHLGTAREVVTRMLRYFQNENLVVLRRGIVEIADEKRLRALADE